MVDVCAETDPGRPCATATAASAAPIPPIAFLRDIPFSTLMGNNPACPMPLFSGEKLSKSTHPHVKAICITHGGKRFCMEEIDAGLLREFRSFLLIEFVFIRAIRVPSLLKLQHSNTNHQRSANLQLPIRDLCFGCSLEFGRLGFGCFIA